MQTIFVLLIISLLSVPGLVFAHGGGLDNSGGHHDNKHGGYHYHTGGSSSSGGSGAYKPADLFISFPGADKAKSKQKRIKNTRRITKAAVVTDVADGDTITVKIDGIETKMRLFGIDCPESGQQYGRAAKRAIAQILSGRDIKVEILGYDRYDRALAVVYADGKSVNEIMVKAGYAWVFEKYCNREFCDEWTTYQDEARRSSMAIWSSEKPIPPWEWRLQK
jgi:endonuclease YncB( thermonuclease family)